MIILKSDSIEGKFLDSLSYYKDKPFLTKLIMQITKRIRSHVALSFMNNKEKHLDIGCGDGYFIKRSPCIEKYAMDQKYGDFFNDKLDFSSGYFDYVTMIAVIEHLTHPQCALEEIHRILKPKGQFIFTTPKKISEKFVKLYMKNIEQHHEQYFNLKAIQKMTNKTYNIVLYKTFMLGLNQLFVLEKK